MAYTPHGHHIPGTNIEHEPDVVARCGGVTRCNECAIYANSRFVRMNGQYATLEQVASPDAPREVNERGGSQSHIPARFDLVDGKAMFAMAQVLHQGAEKYGANNWRLIPVEDHLNHLMMHIYAYLSGDRSDEHLSHIMCRAMFAQGVAFDQLEGDTPSTS